MTTQTEDEYWEERLVDLTRQGLDTTRKAAAGWAALLGGVLGVYGTVAFAGGLTSLDRLAAPFDDVTKLATVAAVVALVIATIYAAKASQSTSASAETPLTWIQLRDRSNAAANSSVKNLRISKIAGVIAASIVLLGSTAVLLMGEAQKPSEPPTVLAVVGGDAVCGKLDRAGGALRVDGVELSDVSDLLVVTTCP